MIITIQVVDKETSFACPVYNINEHPCLILELNYYNEDHQHYHDYSYHYRLQNLINFQYNSITLDSSKRLTMIF